MTIEELFKKFTEKKIIVLGDVMIDAYIYGGVTRVSPEAPVPIVNFDKSEDRLGGAANVALNLVSLGAKVFVSTVIGKDKEGETMLQLLSEQGISTDGIIVSSERQTTVKTRVLGNHQQLLRIDQEQTDDISTEEERNLLQNLEQLFQQGCDALIFQDYNKGVLTPSLIQQVIQLAEKYSVITTVDPKLKNFLSYKGVTLFKPNLKELSDGLQRTINFGEDKHGFYQAVQDLKDELDAEILFVTMSHYGVFIQNEKENHHIPAYPRNISDVSGAGDTVISVATLCLSAGLGIKNVAAFANLAGGIVCEYRGVVAINSEQLKAEAKKSNLDVV